MRDGVDPHALQMLEWIEHRLALHGVKGQPEAVREGVNSWRIFEPHSLPSWGGLVMTPEDLSKELKASAWVVAFQEECFREMRRSGAYASIPTPAFSMDLLKEGALRNTERIANQLLAGLARWRGYNAYWGHRAASAPTLTLFVESRTERETVFIDVPAVEVWAFGNSEEENAAFCARLLARLSPAE